MKPTVLGFLYGVLAALAFAISPVLIRKGLEGLPSPLWGTSIGVATAAVLYAIWLTLRRGWLRVEGPVRSVIWFQVFAGTASGLAVALRNIALNLAPINVVAPLNQTVTLFTLIFMPIFLGRGVEKVTGRLVIGVVCIVGGSVLVVVGQSLQ